MLFCLSQDMHSVYSQIDDAWWISASVMVILISLETCSSMAVHRSHTVHHNKKGVNAKTPLLELIYYCLQIFTLVSPNTLNFPFHVCGFSRLHLCMEPVRSHWFACINNFPFFCSEVNIFVHEIRSHLVFPWMYRDILEMNKNTGWAFDNGHYKFTHSFRTM